MLRSLLLSTLITLGGALPAAHAAGDDPSDASALKPMVEALRAGQYAAAIPRLDNYTLQYPKDANGWNWLGYAYRKNGQLKLAFARYERALALDPSHRGAHEYIGEAYLQDHQPEQARKHLQRLEALCPGGCEELSDLRQALAAYKPRAP
jgi:Flp pilus assembly protein TadD